MAIRMQQRRGTSEQWAAANPILAPGEIGWESETNKFKIGDGVNNWEDLSYFADEDTLGGSIDDYIPLTQKGVANGVATLDGAGKVPYSQIPSIDELSQDAINTALTAGTGITKNYNDNSDTITIGVDTTTIATKSYVDDEISNIDLSTKQDVVAGVTSTEIGYLDGVTSNIQTQIDGKAASSHTHSLVDVTDVTASAAEVNLLDGVTATTTEINYLDGVTSSIQTQLDDKAPLSSPTFTGTVSGITASMVGLGNVNNTSDADKPVSTATQTALDAKLDLAGGTMTGALTLSGAPTQALHAATKAYADSIAEGLHIHPSVVAATSANVNISTDLEPGDIVDDVTLAEGDRVLVKSQTNAAQNGIYVVQASGAALRAADFNEPSEVDGGDFVFVTGGTLYDNTGWVQTTTNVVTVGTDPIEFTQFSGAGTYVAGTGITITGNEIAADTTVVAPLAGPTFTGTVTLPSTTSIGNVSSTELGYLDGVTSAIQTQLDAKASSSHTHTTADISNVSAAMRTFLTTPTSGNLASAITGETGSGDLVFSTSPALTSPSIVWPNLTLNPTVSTSLGRLTRDGETLKLGMGNSQTVTFTNDEDLVIAQSQVTNLTTDLAAKAPVASPTFTGTVTLPSDTSIGDVSSTELGYLDGVTSNIQTQLDSKVSSTSQAVSSNITLAASNKYFVDTSTARTLTLPASPSLGDEIQVFDASGTAGANNITVQNNSNKINGTLDYAILDVNGVAAVFVWTGSTYGWRMG